MRILVLSSFGEVCGVAAYAAEMRNALAAAGHSVDVFPIGAAALDRLARADLLPHFEGCFARVERCDAIPIRREYSLFGGFHGCDPSCTAFDPLLARAGGIW